MKPLTRLYDRLTPDERLRLFVEAAARGDEAELDWINETCPRAKYEMIDPIYVGQLHDLSRIT